MKEVARLHIDELVEGSAVRVHHPPFDIAVVRSGGQLFALRDACPHSGHSLSAGHVERCVLTCPMHGWQIDVRSGEVLTAAGAGERAVTFAVRVEDTEVVIGYDEGGAPTDDAS